MVFAMRYTAQMITREFPQDLYDRFANFVRYCFDDVTMHAVTVYSTENRADTDLLQTVTLPNGMGIEEKMDSIVYEFNRELRSWDTKAVYAPEECELLIVGCSKEESDRMQNPCVDWGLIEEQIPADGEIYETDAIV
jgi:hypothetical protein